MNTPGQSDIQDANPAPLIFAFLDYREYLEAYFAFRKRSDPVFSLRTFSRHPDLALSSSSFLSAVITGRKNLSQNLRLRFGRALGLKASELEYFELLIQFNQSKSPEEGNHFFSRLSRFHESKIRFLPESLHKFYAHWFYGVVWNYIGIHPDQSNPALIGKQVIPPLSPKQVEEAIQQLLEMKLIKKLANGYAVTDRHLAGGTGVPGAVSGAYTQSFLKMAQASLEQVAETERRFNVLSFSISPHGLERIMDRLDGLRAEIREIVETDAEPGFDSGHNAGSNTGQNAGANPGTNTDRGYALAWQLFPTTLESQIPLATGQVQAKAHKLRTTSESGNPSKKDLSNFFATP